MIESIKLPIVIIICLFLFLNKKIVIREPAPEIRVSVPMGIKLNAFKGVSEFSESVIRCPV
jgi:hypothetical protein